MIPDLSQLRRLPSVNVLLQFAREQYLLSSFSHFLVVQDLRVSLEEARAAIRASLPCPSSEMLLTSAEQFLLQQSQSHLRPVINATGVVINTNLGRAP